MNIDTTAYIRSHGKPPRGAGLWGFAIEGAKAGRPHQRQEFLHGKNYKAAWKELAWILETQGVKASRVALLP